jgi:uncharacterized protein
MQDEMMVKLASIVKERIIDLEKTTHFFDHLERVLRTAVLLSEKEGADLELVQLGALLHDVGHAIGEPHNETGARLAREILREVGYPEEIIEKVARIVFRHRQSLDHELETIEEKIVWDADKIDLIGVTGVLRAFHCAGSTGISFEDHVKWSQDKQTKFYGLLKTESAKKIAKKRHVRMMCLLEVLEKELTLADLQI